MPSSICSPTKKSEIKEIPQDQIVILREFSASLGRYLTNASILDHDESLIIAGGFAISMWDNGWRLTKD